MNAPMELRPATLDDKYENEDGLVYLTGTQALVLLPMLQRRRDAAAGLNTAGYVSGYRGSPLGAYDLALGKARTHLEKHHVTFVPGLNEDLAATAVWGTQQANAFPGARYDGVFGIWYGKGPGVDRAGDVLRHANQAGTARYGGVIALAGDDHGAKSSTVAAQTDFLFQAVSMPVLAPATTQDYIDLGLTGIAMSRFTGTWVAIKAVTDTIETAGIVDVSSTRLAFVDPEHVPMPPGGLNLRWPEEPFIKLEERLAKHKMPAVLAWARANRLDRQVLGVPNGEPARLGIVSTGKAWLDVMQALADMGIDDAVARRIGIRVYKVAMPWPLEPEGAREFCAGCNEVLVIEEKRSLIESQLRDALYALPARPRVTGKVDADGVLLLPEWGELSPALCLRTIAARLRASGPAAGDDPLAMRALQAVQARCDQRMSLLATKEQDDADRIPPAERTPYFCSGCPHNSSTKVPEGSRAVAGIGCSYMATWMDRSTATFTHMGGEGGTWIGQAPYTETPHVFQNLGDGTYFHSGSLAIRHAVATRTPITYKILFNDAVAMTGGQEHDGQLTPAAIARQVAAEGVKRIVVVTDDPGKYPVGYFDPGMQVHHRSELDAVQRDLREYADVSVLIYDQTCAAEKRRRRKRSTEAVIPKRVFINEQVCENCGDCTVKSNCVSVQPVETELGRKRTIDQSSCNSDRSCVDGFCPSFVTVEGGALRTRATAESAKADVAGSARAASLPSPPSVLPEPELPGLEETYSLLVTGIGGTGVITIGHLLGIAAHLEGKSVTVLDMTGLAQKNGAVMSFIRFGAPGQALYSPRIGAASADAVIGCDLIVTAGREALSRMAVRRTRVVANAAITPTADFARKADWAVPQGALEAEIERAVGSSKACAYVDATRVVTAILGDSIATNMFMLGYAWQQGLIPVSAVAIERAIDLNRVSVADNRTAFAWGRAAAADPARVERITSPAQPIQFVPRVRTRSLSELVESRKLLLTAYQDAAYARQYTEFVERVAEAERRATAGSSTRLSEAVARSLGKLMAYKDEYEVARLFVDNGFMERLRGQLAGDYKLSFHLAPPLWARPGADGHPRKRAYGAWMLGAFHILARLRRVRGTVFDVFGYTAERRAERAHIASYRTTIEGLLEQLNVGNLAIAVQIAALPNDIRGFGHVRAASAKTVSQRQFRLVEEYMAFEGLKRAA
ncbi:indolepyruvate ferredoxin oxidoreductase family protein [Variovorax sp. J22P168]|uniref:indolepyruvate ferredoxin oxidoreductase family protein n=1 Tax=Variovorax jilinensis TaxID=3053513 RepID=UPI002576F166|nr:indolepyruvate ferredoxin oxidoreductase family protein [Variovorax sp. J22P168]MDM0014926.1 indolepyruvate ferredoxin oxidoreductase family protein [Variovorax sp. J22P168]